MSDFTERKSDTAAESVAAAGASPATPRTFNEWWRKRGGKLPHNITRREIAILAWSAAREAAWAPAIAKAKPLPSADSEETP